MLERSSSFGMCVCNAWLIALAACAVAAPAMAASPQECATYAEGAVKDYNTATNPANAQRCHVPLVARWQPSFQNHYNWCLTVSNDAYLSEKNAREAILRKCGARSGF
jgi:hypothetical protein